MVISALNPRHLVNSSSFGRFSPIYFIRYRLYSINNFNRLCGSNGDIIFVCNHAAKMKYFTRYAIVRIARALRFSLSKNRT